MKPLPWSSRVSVDGFYFLVVSAVRRFVLLVRVGSTSRVLLLSADNDVSVLLAVTIWNVFNSFKLLCLQTVCVCIASGMFWHLSVASPVLLNLYEVPTQSAGLRAWSAEFTAA